MTFPGTEPTDVFPCGGCGQPIRANDGHRYDDCVARRRRCAEALAGMDPAKLAALIESTDFYLQAWPLADDGTCTNEKCDSPLCGLRGDLFRALAELRGEEAHRG